MMTLLLPQPLLAQIQAHGAASYPQEGAGLLLGARAGDECRVQQVLPLENTFEESQRGRRYMIDPRAMMEAEEQAEEQGQELLGVFHSHPDHPAQPSEYDRKMALPWIIYLITSVQAGQPDESRAWRLLEDRSSFDEVPLKVRPSKENVT